MVGSPLAHLAWRTLLQRILRLPSLAPRAPARSLALVVAGCGGDEAGSSADELDTSVDELLEQTFSGEKKVDSGKLDLSLTIDVQGGGSQVQGPITLTLSGPFQTQGEGKLPKFDIDVAFEGAGQNIKAGVDLDGRQGAS